MKHTTITITKGGEIHQTQNNNTQRAKIDKLGGLNKARRVTQGMQKNEAVQNKIAFKIDRATDQRNQRKAKRANKI